MRRTMFVVAAVLFMLFAMNATASMITFVETGTASGYYYGTRFTNLPFTITATADTEKRYWDPWLGDPRGWEVDSASAFITIDDVLPVAIAANYTQFMILNSASSIFSNLGAPDVWTLLTGPYSNAFTTWNLTFTIPGYGRGGNSIPLYIDFMETLSFTTIGQNLQSPSTVPEPGTLALVGAGVFALAVYRKRTKKASFR